MSDLLLPTNNWFGFSAPQDSALNNGWEDLDHGDLKLFLAIEELLTGTQKAGLELSCSETAT
jgi:hypothetical protein